tara:strand:- start:865 stop:1038 length:174 start_codon:yes stop_codon:yes gene_type:complete
MTPNMAWERIRLANQALYNIGSKTILGSTSYDLLVDTNGDEPKVYEFIPVSEEIGEA